MLLRRALRTLGRAARRVSTLLARGVAPTGGGTGSPALFALFGKKGRPGGIPKKPIAGRGAAPPAPTPHSPGRGKRAAVSLAGKCGAPLRQGAFAAYAPSLRSVRYSTFPLTAFPRSRPRPSAPITPGEALRGRDALPMRLHTRGLANLRLRPIRKPPEIVSGGFLAFRYKRASSSVDALRTALRPSRSPLALQLLAGLPHLLRLGGQCAKLLADALHLALDDPVSRAGVLLDPPSHVLPDGEGGVRNKAL